MRIVLWNVDLMNQRTVSIVVDFKYLDIDNLTGKTVIITKAEKDNIEMDIDGEKFFLYPLCRSCEYNDEVLIFGEITHD